MQTFICISSKNSASSWNWEHIPRVLSGAAPTGWESSVQSGTTRTLKIEKNIYYSCIVYSIIHVRVYQALKSNENTHDSEIVSEMFSEFLNIHIMQYCIMSSDFFCKSNIRHSTVKKEYTLNDFENRT